MNHLLKLWSVGSEVHRSLSGTVWQSEKPDFSRRRQKQVVMKKRQDAGYLFFLFKSLLIDLKKNEMQRWTQWGIDLGWSKEEWRCADPLQRSRPSPVWSNTHHRHWYLTSINEESWSKDIKNKETSLMINFFSCIVPSVHTLGPITVSTLRANL